MQRAPLHRMNGLGNKITVLDLRTGGPEVTGDRVLALADDPRTRFDQLMVLLPSSTDETSARLQIFNVDGSRAGACGNGMRCVGLAVVESGGDADQLYETDAGLLSVSVTDAEHVSVDMGRPKFGWEDIPLADPFHDTTGIELQVGPIDAPVLHTPSVCSMGNPHAVFWVDDVDAIDLAKFGSLLEYHPIFPEQANISIAQVVSPKAAKVRTWERGAGLTQACGSAACAVLVCGVRKELLQRTATITVPGGDLTVTWTDQDRVILSGPAELEATGTASVAADGKLKIEMADLP